MTKPTENIELYGVVDREGRLYENRDGRPCIYGTMQAARRQCDEEGDAVVTVSVHLDREPLFIRAKPLEPGGGWGKR